MLTSTGEELRIDTLVYATGFDVVCQATTKLKKADSQLGSSLDIRGRDRRSADLMDKRLAMKTYHGVCRKRRQA